MTKYASLVQHLKINNVVYLINSLKKNHMVVSINTGAIYKSQQAEMGPGGGEELSQLDKQHLPKKLKITLYLMLRN